MNLRPLHDRVVIKRYEEQTESAGGIILTGGNKEESTQGEIIAVADSIDANLAVGQRVIFGNLVELSHKVEDEEFLIMREENVLAVIDD